MSVRHPNARSSQSMSRDENYQKHMKPHSGGSAKGQPAGPAGSKTSAPPKTAMTGKPKGC